MAVSLLTWLFPGLLGYLVGWSVAYQFICLPFVFVLVSEWFSVFACVFVYVLLCFFGHIAVLWYSFTVDL